VESGALLNILDGHEDEITTVAVINDMHVITGSRDNTLRIWHMDKGKCLKVFHGHSDDITVVKVTAYGKIAFSASRDQTCRLWYLSSGDCLYIFKFFDEICRFNNFDVFLREIFCVPCDEKSQPF
jgi:WD40 repeat protein